MKPNLPCEKSWQFNKPVEIKKNKDKKEDEPPINICNYHPFDLKTILIALGLVGASLFICFLLIDLLGVAK